MIYCKGWEKLSSEQKIENIKESLESDIARWDYLSKNGSSDPFWPDGVNMNLVRSHVIFDLKMLAEFECKPRQMSFFDEEQTSIGEFDPCDSRIPPEVDSDYMVKERRCFYFDNRK